MVAYYNECDSSAAAWLRALISEGQIAKGEVDERSIVDVDPSDLWGYTQHYFFAGIGVWSHALRRAGWEDDRPIWTGSCPCQPFSAAGKGLGFSDPRHLWPHFLRLIRECRPDTVIGEQVASAGEWIDLVRGDMEAIDYAFGVVDVPAAGFSGAHLRQRAYWVANAESQQWNGGGNAGRGWREFADSSAICGMVHPDPTERGTDATPGNYINGKNPGRPEGSGDFERSSRVVGVGDHHHQGLSVRQVHPDERGAIRYEGTAFGETGLLRGCDWLFCHDAKFRPVEPSTFPLAHAAPARVGRLRGYGNALDAETASNFIGAYMEALEDL